MTLSEPLPSFNSASSSFPLSIRIWLWRGDKFQNILSVGEPHLSFYSSLSSRCLPSKRASFMLSTVRCLIYEMLQGLAYVPPCLKTLTFPFYPFMISLKLLFSGVNPRGPIYFDSSFQANGPMEPRPQLHPQSYSIRHLHRLFLPNPYRWNWQWV